MTTESRSNQPAQETGVSPATDVVPATGVAAGSVQPLVVSIVVDYDGLDDTLRCVRSLLDSSYDSHRIVVVDNGSPSGDGPRLSAEFGDSVVVISSERNLGYGGGANLGLSWALENEAAYAWVLNNDTIVDPTCIGRLVEAMESHPEFGVLSPQIAARVGPEAPSGIWYAGGTVLLRRAEVRHSFEEIQGPAPVPTQYVTGCAMFLRSSSLAEVGLFWEPLFLFWEDVDLSLRMRRSGLKLGVVPAARIRHEIHGSIGPATLEYYHFRNAFVVVRKYGSASTALSGLLFLAGGVARRWARAMLRRRPAPIAATRGLVAGLRLAIGSRSAESPRRDQPRA